MTMAFASPQPKHKVTDLPRVYARNLVALGRLDPFIVNEQTGGLCVLDTIRCRKLNLQTRHSSLRNNSKKLLRSRVSWKLKRKRSRKTEERAVHGEKEEERGKVS